MTCHDSVTYVQVWSNGLCWKEVDDMISIANLPVLSDRRPLEADHNRLTLQERNMANLCQSSWGIQPLLRLFGFGISGSIWNTFASWKNLVRPAARLQQLDSRINGSN